MTILQSSANNERGIEEVHRPLGGQNANAEQLREFLARSLDKATATYDGLYGGWPNDWNPMLAIASREDKELAPLNETQQAMEEWEALKGAIFTRVKRKNTFSPAQVIYELSTPMRTPPSPCSA